MSSNKKENWKSYFDEKVTKEIPKIIYKKTNKICIYRLEKIQEFLINEKKFFRDLRNSKNENINEKSEGKCK